jgi:hypothetical protein
MAATTQWWEALGAEAGSTIANPDFTCVSFGAVSGVLCVLSGSGASVCSERGRRHAASTQLGGCAVCECSTHSPLVCRRRAQRQDAD